MAISILRAGGRQVVAWFGNLPPDAESEPFAQRQFVIDACDDIKLHDPAYLSGLAAVVFVQNPTKPLQIEERLENHAGRLLDYDCRVILRPSANGTKIVENILGRLRLPTAGLRLSQSGEPPLPHLRVAPENVPWGQLADSLLMYPPGEAPSLTLKIEPPSIEQQLTGTREILLRRAFHDCSEIYLTPMESGRSGVAVYRVHAELAKGLEGQWPMPLFVKIGKRRKIFAEYENYEGRVGPYVPFHLGPHLVRERCCLGALAGVIVGDYVDESECLTDCAREGRASPAIACLFDRTLAGWHRRGRTEAESSIAKLLAPIFPAKVPPARLAFSRALGATQALPELRGLFDRCASVPVLVGPIHGDLHARNVRVRATDAIVIDFFAHRDCPLLFDAASLEASLLVEGFGTANTDIHEWMKSVEALYEYSPLEGATPHPNPKNSAAWFYSCVRQIRRYAHQWELHEHQYAGALAAALLSKAAKDSASAEPEASRRAAAYVFAERILLAAFGKSAAELAPAAARAQSIAPDVPTATNSP